MGLVRAVPRWVNAAQVPAWPALGTATSGRGVVARCAGRMEVADFVLKDFSGVERKELPLLLVEAADAVEVLLEAGLGPAQNQVHPRA